MQDCLFVDLGFCVGSGFGTITTPGDDFCLGPCIGCCASTGTNPGNDVGASCKSETMGLQILECC